MVRIIGTILLLAGSSGIAYSYCREQNERLKTLRSMREVFIRIKKEIEYLKASLPEICLSLGGQNIIFSDVFAEIYNEMELNNGRSFIEIWQLYFDERLKRVPLTEKEKEMIKGFPDCLVYRDSEGQAEGIDKYIDEAGKCIEDLANEIKNKNKVILCMGVMAGMIAVVILI